MKIKLTTACLILYIALTHAAVAAESMVKIPVFEGTEAIPGTSAHGVSTAAPGCQRAHHPGLADLLPRRPRRTESRPHPGTHGIPTRKLEPSVAVRTALDHPFRP